MRDVQLPAWIQQEIAAVDRIVFDRGVVLVFQRLDVPHDRPRAACAGDVFLFVGSPKKSREAACVREIVLPHFRHEFHQAKRLSALYAHFPAPFVVMAFYR